MKSKPLKSIQKVRLKQVRDGRVRFAVDKISRPIDVFRAVLPYYKGADREILSVLCLDAQNAPRTSNREQNLIGLNMACSRSAGIKNPHMNITSGKRRDPLCLLLKAVFPSELPVSAKVVFRSAHATSK